MSLSEHSLNTGVIRKVSLQCVRSVYQSRVHLSAVLAHKPLLTVQHQYCNCGGCIIIISVLFLPLSPHSLSLSHTLLCLLTIESTPINIYLHLLYKHSVGLVLPSLHVQGTLNITPLYPLLCVFLPEWCQGIQRHSTACVFRERHFQVLRHSLQGAY